MDKKTDSTRPEAAGDNVEPMLDGDILFKMVDYDALLSEQAQTLRHGLIVGFICGTFFGIILGLVSMSQGAGV